LALKSVSVAVVEAYNVILLSTINPLALAWQRFAGTALGAALGAVIATFFHANWIVYGVGIFV